MAPIRLWELAAVDSQHVFSPSCWRSRLAMLHKGLEYESVPWCAPGQAGMAPHAHVAACAAQLSPVVGIGACEVLLMLHQSSLRRRTCLGGTRRSVRAWAKPNWRVRRRYVEGEKLRAASGQGLRAEAPVTPLEGVGPDVMSKAAAQATHFG